MNFVSPGAIELIHGNRLEELAEQLAQRLMTQSESGAVLVPDIVIVPHPGMARWLKLWLADRLGICANIEFPLPAVFAWRILSERLGPLPTQSGFAREILVWRILDLLPQVWNHPDNHIIAAGLPLDVESQQAYALAVRLADLFDQYLVYRPDWLKAWEQERLLDLGVHEKLQARLWRLLVSSIYEPHRALLFQRLFDTDPLRSVATPVRRIYCFGLTQLAPVYLDVLRFLARDHLLTLFQFNPSLQYWADLVSERELARLKALWAKQGRGDLGDYFEVGHPLLASWGKPGRYLFKHLHSGELAADVDVFVDATNNTLLGSLQNSILYADPTRCLTDPLAADNSLRIHACASRLREVEVLHDVLLAALQKDATLKPADIAVMVPNIGDYASAVAAIFARPERPIPYRIADRSCLEQHPLIQNFLALLGVTEWRFSASEILGLLATPALARCFNISQSERSALTRWTRESGIRWGLDKEFRVELKTGDYADYSWQSGLQRALVGYACGEGVAEWQQIAPYPDIEGQATLALGQLILLLQRLQRLRQTLQMKKSVKDWINTLYRVLEDFYAPAATDSEAQTALAELRTALITIKDTAADAEHSSLLSFASLRIALEEQLTQPSSLSRFPGEGVTVCSLVPLRTVPFRIIALLGLNAEEFPTVMRGDSFNLLLTHPREGDRMRRDDECFLFLEALLSARDKLHLSYIGMRAQDGKVQACSPVVEELLDFVVRQSFCGNVEKAHQFLIRRHPIYPFAKDYFRGQANERSFAAQWLPAACADSDKSVTTPFALHAWPTSSDEIELQELELDTLIRFFRHPSRFQLREKLGIELGNEISDIRDDEPFGLASLERYAARTHLLETALQQNFLPTTLSPALRALGGFPAGIAGERWYALERELIVALAAAMRDSEQTLEKSTRPFRMNVAEIILHGIVEYNHLLLYRVTQLRAGDLLQAWIVHLLLEQLDLPGRERFALGLTNGVVQKVIFQSLTPADAKAHLGDLIALYRESRRRPLPLFPGSQLTYMQAMARNGTGSESLEAARKAWNGDEWQRGESEDPYAALLARGREPLFDNEFIELAKRLFAPLLEASK